MGEHDDRPTNSEEFNGKAVVAGQGSFVASEGATSPPEHTGFTPGDSLKREPAVLDIQPPPVPQPEEEDDPLALPDLSHLDKYKSPEEPVIHRDKPLNTAGRSARRAAIRKRLGVES